MTLSSTNKQHSLAPKSRSRRHRLDDDAPTSDNSNTAAATTLTSKSSNSSSVADAKAKFVSSVSRGIAVLMGEFGYSRERATTALLREIARSGGDAATIMSHAPTEQEVSLL